jgi:Tol biopolymer transport system component
VYAPKQEQLGGLEHWSADGKYLVAMASVGSKRTVLRIPVDGSEQPLVLSEGLNLIDEMRLSPDGRWLAFNAAISDRNEIYVSPVPPTGERLQISTNGGVSARWRDDGRELYFLDPAGTLMAVSMTMRAARLEPSVPTALFKTGVPPSYNLDHFAVGPGGKAFLVRLSASTNEVPTLKLLVNWFR